MTILSSYNIVNKKFVVNRARGDLIQDKIMIDIYDIGKTLNIDFCGVVPEDDGIITTTSESVKNYKIASNRAFEILANNIVFNEKKLFDCTYKYKGVIGTIKKLLRRSV